MKTISTDELKEWIQNWFETNRHYHPYSKQNNIPIPELYDILERMPTIEPKRGEWIAVTKDDLSRWECSLCGKPALLDDNEQMELSNFCPNCGARMNSSEKPNNCEWSVEYAREKLNTMTCEECGHWEHGAGDHYYCALLEMRQERCFESKDESTLMFANKPKDEPQTEEEELLEIYGFEADCAWK